MLDVGGAQAAVIHDELIDYLLRFDEREAGEVLDEAHAFGGRELDLHGHARRLLTDNPLEERAVVLEAQWREAQDGGVRTQRVGQADILVAGHDERASSLRELRRHIADVPLDHGIAKPRREAAEVKDPGALALDEPESIGGILHRLRRFLVDIGVGGVHSPAQAAAPRPRVVMQLELGGDLLKQLVDTLLFERVDDD